MRLLEAIAARAGVANKLAADRRRIDVNLPRDVGLRVAALQERVNLAALFAGQMEIAFGHFSSVRCAVPRKDSLHLTARKTGIHNMAKSGGRKRRPQGCSLRSHRLQRLKPLTPTLSPATHSPMPSMLPCCLVGNCHAANSVGLEVFPDQFVWIAVGRIGRQKKQPQSAVLAVDKSSGLLGNVGGAAIDDQENRALGAGHQALEKLDEDCCIHPGARSRCSRDP